MTATLTTREVFEGSVPAERMDREVALRVKAGAIRSNYEKEGADWVLATEWNVIGEQ